MGGVEGRGYREEKKKKRYVLVFGLFNSLWLLAVLACLTELV